MSITNEEDYFEIPTSEHYASNGLTYAEQRIVLDNLDAAEEMLARVAAHKMCDAMVRAGCQLILHDNKKRRDALPVKCFARPRPS